MKKTFPRLIAFILLLIISAQLFSACSNTDTTGNSDIPNMTNAPNIEIEDNGRDRVPEMNFDGYNFKAYSIESDFYHGTIRVESENGDVLNDARYTYIRTIEERFNIIITETLDTAVSDAPRINILAGDNAYDMLNLKANDSIEYAIENLTYIIEDLPYVDLDRPYWDDSLNSELSIRNETYFAVAPFNLPVYDFSHALLFNKEMITSFGLDNPYELVTDGKWNVDEFSKMTLQVTSDVNGNGVFDAGDTYGFLAQPKSVLPSFWIAAGESTIKKEADGTLYFAAPGSSKFASIVDKMFNITWDNNTWFRNESTTNYDPLLRNMFKNNQGLFFDTQVFYIRELRDMETDFGILPYPKFTPDQENYYTRVETVVMFSVPITNTALEMTSAIIEALACEAADQVIPAYCEIALKNKFSRDKDSSEMLDVLFGSMTIDFGDSVWASAIRDGVLRLMFLNNERDLASKLASIEAPVNAMITETMDSYEALKNK